MILSVVVSAIVGGLNLWLYLGAGLVLPLAGALIMIATAFALNGMLWQGWDSLNTQYELLLEFIGDHPDAMTIRRALD